MKDRIKKIWVVLVTLMIALSFALASDSWAKKKRKYKYIYYPTQQVYYSPVLGRYYYMSGGNWIYGAAPPAQIRLGKGISINLGGDVPYVYHPTVIQRYPAPVIVVDDD